MGEYAVVSFVCSKGKPIPTLFGFGVINSSTLFGLPAPNWIWRFFSDVNLVANLLCTFFNFSKKGISF